MMFIIIIFIIIITIIRRYFGRGVSNGKKSGVGGGDEYRI